MLGLPSELVARARDVLSACERANAKVAAAESCTGGLVMAALTSLSGSSAWVERGFVTYSNEAKCEMLDVPRNLIERVGAVSEEVARSMAEGALAASSATAAVSITGIAGPTGGTPDKPVGTVHIAAAAKGRTTLHRACLFSGDRDAVRHASAMAALEMLLEIVERA